MNARRFNAAQREYDNRIPPDARGQGLCIRCHGRVEETGTLFCCQCAQLVQEDEFDDSDDGDGKKDSDMERDVEAAEQRKWECV